jgi:hypothetical protein
MEKQLAEYDISDIDEYIKMLNALKEMKRKSLGILPKKRQAESPIVMQFEKKMKIYRIFSKRLPSRIIFRYSNKNLIE